MNMKILILLALMMTGCETVYYRNTVYQIDYVGPDTASEDTTCTSDVEDDTTDIYCDSRYCL